MSNLLIYPGLPTPEPLIPDWFRSILASLGFDEQGRALAPAIFVLCTIFSWPFALSLRYMTHAWSRMIMSSVIGAIITVGVYGPGMTGLFVAVVAAFYFPCRFRMMRPGMSTLMSLALLGAIHYESMLTGTATDRMSHTGTLMVMVAKISMFAFHLEDGFKLSRGISLSTHAHIADHRKKQSIDPKDVSLLKFLVYMFEFQGSLVGPLFSYSEYQDFYYNRGDFSNVSKAPFAFQSLKATARAFAILGSYVFLSKQWWFGAETLLTDWFQGLPFLHKLLISPFIVAGCRLAYYAVWALSEVACTLSGIAFVPPNRFTRGRNCNLRMFELSPNFNSVTNNWNIRISDLWLKQCIYQRVENVPRGMSRKGIANFVTKLTSALWHGWYPGYSVSFLSLGLCNWSETMLRMKVHHRLPSWFNNSPVVHVLGWMHTWWSVNIFFVPFLLLSWEKTVVFYSSMLWCGHLYHVSLIVLCSVLPSHLTDKQKSQ